MSLKIALGSLRAHAPRSVPEITHLSTHPSVLRCSNSPLDVPLSSYLSPEPQPVPREWPQGHDHLIEKALPRGLRTWWIAVYFGSTQDWRADFARLEREGLRRQIPGAVDTSRLGPDSLVLLIHRHALHGQPAAVALVPIESLSELP